MPEFGPFPRFDDSAALTPATVGGSRVFADVQYAIVPGYLDTMQAETSAESPFQHDTADSSESLLIDRPLTENRDRARWASPISHVSERTAPTLLIHGRDDLVVPHQQSVAYHDALVVAGVPAMLTLVDGADHCFIGVDSAPLVLQTAEFLAKALHAGAAE